MAPLLQPGKALQHVMNASHLCSGFARLWQGSLHSPILLLLSSSSLAAASAAHTVAVAGRCLRSPCVCVKGR
jgi:hypothetical protein